MRKIQPSKLSMKFFSCIIVRACGIAEIIKITKIHPLAVHGYSDSPFAIVFSPAHALKPAMVAFPNFLIFGILRMRAISKIFAAIVERVSVLMVTLLLIGAGKDLTMHADQITSRAAWTMTNGIKRICAWVIKCKPIPLAEPFIISNIHNCILALRKRDQAVRIIKRLSNCVTLHAEFWHRSTSNGLLRLSRYNITEINLRFVCVGN